MKTDDIRQTFSMIDFDSDLPQVLVEMTYAEDVFDLHDENETGKPIVITLREKPEHFEKRQR